MKKNNGVSLISLVVTIVLVLILASVSIYYGLTQNIDTAYEADRYTEIMNISDAAYQRHLTNRMDPTRYPYVGTPLTNSSPKTINNIAYGDGWYLLKPEESLNLGLENVGNEYIINYQTGEVVSTEPIFFNNAEYYTSNEIRNIDIE